MPIVAMFRELKKMKYRGLIALEYEIDPKAPLPGMQKSFAYMRGVLAGLSG
jgi:sugar phosphate isomerase/epimerase